MKRKMERKKKGKEKMKIATWKKKEGEGFANAKHVRRDALDSW